ncbi:hypothetical protein [Hydrogenophaga sp. 2FB]|uniref:hypothetical protein n=1 Tax=Hydrogenophaga sp. 2FB TaxID=2502187 RepID=UPI0010F4B8DB|nr:hypothetical protein [Hydrogenophaga sp. 2FB]
MKKMKKNEKEHDCNRFDVALSRGVRERFRSRSSPFRQAIGCSEFSAASHAVGRKRDRCVCRAQRPWVVPNKRDRGVIFTTALVIEGATAPLETIPGQYAVAKIKPGKYAVSAQRLCHLPHQRDKVPEIFPPVGTVMPVRQAGWSTYAGSFGQGFMSSDAVFDFRGGKTYVFSVHAYCLRVQSGEVLLHPRIHETDEQGGKYLVMTSTPAKK